MKKTSNTAKIEVQGKEIAIIQREAEDYISQTDMMRNFDCGPALIKQMTRV